MSDRIRVAIIGAGPAGCTLARLLLQHQAADDSASLSHTHLDVSIFEAEATPDFRAQGGTLDLHTSTGLQALKAAGLYHEFLQHARFDGEAFCLVDKHLKSYIRMSQQTGTAEAEAEAGSGTGKHTHSRGAPEIDRAQLRSMLVQALPHGTVRWGWRLETLLSEPPPSPSAPASAPVQVGKLEPAPPSHALHFDNARALPGFDLVVGADGAWSRVRPHLAPFASAAADPFPAPGETAAAAAKPLYAGITGFSCSIPDAARTAPEVYELVNRGSLFAFSDGKALTGQQLGDGSIWVGASAVKGEDWVAEQQRREQQYRCQQQQHEQGLAAGDAARDRYRVGPWFKAWVRAEYKDWAPELLQLVEASDDDSARLRPAYMLPVGFRWRSQPGLTLIGDAAHLTVPFAGEGVNIALEDALKLSCAIIAALETPTTANHAEQPRLDLVRRTLAANVADFERDMFVRSQTIQTVSVGMMRAMFFTPGAPRSSIHTYISWKAWQMQPLLYPLIAVVVYVYFAIWKLFN